MERWDSYDEFVGDGRPERIRNLVGILAHTAGAKVTDGIANAPLPPMAQVRLLLAVRWRSPPDPAVSSCAIRRVSETVGVAILPARPWSLAIGRRGRCVKVWEFLAVSAACVAVRVGVGGMERRGAHRIRGGMWHCCNRRPGSRGFVNEWMA